MYHQHQCLVFEMLSANLYTLLERVDFHGFSLPLVRKFASQLFVSLQFLARPDVRVIHTDIKVTEQANLSLETLDPKPNLASDQRPDPPPLP
mmetsp:Transcript_45556/g.125823  ORF Transcript_45556/g.125823 Transcript_45556/m.125823 type:complete len:92 (-) Transcript_45556:52-327(-)